MSWQITTGQVIGREHIRLWRNSQDAMLSGVIKPYDDEWRYGLLADGCSEGQHSEVGAWLTVNWLKRRLEVVIGGSGRPSAWIDRLYDMLTNWLVYQLRDVAKTEAGKVAWMKDYLLCTVVGFISGKEETLIFWVGDGVIAVDEQIIRIDRGNQPWYPAYDAIDKVQYLIGKADRWSGFEKLILPTTEISRLAIATDGLDDELVPRIWGHGSDIQLTRELKRLSRMEGRLNDDTSVVVLERE